jgi:hypothetical protein
MQHEERPLSVVWALTNARLRVLRKRGCMLFLGADTVPSTVARQLVPGDARDGCPLTVTVLRQMLFGAVGTGAEIAWVAA